MKLLVFAHKPPPHHGQSFMVQLMLEGFGGDVRSSRLEPTGPVECYHVDCRFSRGIQDIGSMRWEKFLLAIKYSLTAIWCRFRYGVKTFYYVPANPSRAALYRDWVVMALCRPFFPRLIYHWHAVGLADWLQTQARSWERAISHRLIARPELSIVLGEFNRKDAEQLLSLRTVVVPNGVPDPCPHFAESILPLRKARTAARRQLLAGTPLSDSERTAAGGDPEVFRVLYLGLCSRDKGLFDLLEAVAQARKQLADAPCRLRLAVAGTFWLQTEQAEFEQRIAAPDLNGSGDEVIQYLGFVSGEEKRRLFEEADCFCFPTYYAAESFGLVVAEAMAYGLPVVATRWRSVPELLPLEYPGLVEPRAPKELAAALLREMHRDDAGPLRHHFEEHFTEQRFAARLQAALLG